MRNREVGCFAAALLGASAAASLLAAALWGVWAALFCLAACLLLCALALAFTRWRYREIARLSRYLMDVYLGKEPVDIRDERPGELSALKDDLYKVTTVLDTQRAALEKDRTFLSDSLSNIAHHLKTPLAAISLQAELWAEPDTPAEMKSACALTVGEQVDRVQWLVERLLKMSRLDAKAVLFHPEEQPADAVLHRACGSFLAVMGQKNIDFSVDCPDGLICRCDAAWTAEALAKTLSKTPWSIRPMAGVSGCMRKGRPSGLCLLYKIRARQSPRTKCRIFLNVSTKGQTLLPPPPGLGLRWPAPSRRGRAASLPPKICRAACGLRSGCIYEPLGRSRHVRQPSVQNFIPSFGERTCHRRGTGG